MRIASLGFEGLCLPRLGSQKVHHNYFFILSLFQMGDAQARVVAGTAAHVHERPVEGRGCVMVLGGGYLRLQFLTAPDNAGPDAVRVQKLAIRRTGQVQVKAAVFKRGQTLLLFVQIPFCKFGDGWVRPEFWCRELGEGLGPCRIHQRTMRNKI